jgi:hypothetical protein
MTEPTPHLSRELPQEARDYWRIGWTARAISISWRWPWATAMTGPRCSGG